MKTIFHASSERGHNKLSWLNSYHSFSFGHYYDDNKVHFGALRVLNDDTVMPGMGFGSHPHDNMEIVSIPLEGALEHRDSMGSHGIISSGDVQIMSAGTGIMHSEFNHSKTDQVKFLQIWVFPRERQIAPRYDQKSFNPQGRKGVWQTIVDPEGTQGIQIMQEAWFSLSDLEPGAFLDYNLHRSGNGVYFFLLNGSCQIGQFNLNSRDAAGFWETDRMTVTAHTDLSVLAIEVPMEM